MDNFIKKILTLLMAGFLLCYVGYQAFQVFYTPIKAETVYSHTMYETVDTQAFVIRNETPVSQNVEGYVYYTAENGSRVAKDGVIAHIYENEEQARIQRQILQLEEQISALAVLQSQAAANPIQLELINKQIDNALSELVAATNTPIYDSLYDTHARLLSLLNKRQMTIGKVDSFADRIASLTEKKNSLQGLLNVSTQSIQSPVTGYFVSQADGLEDVVDYDKALSLTTEEVNAALNAAPKAVDDATVGKVVGDYEWYLACVLSAQEAGSVKEGASLTVLLPFVSDEAVPVTVAAANRDKDGRVAVVFKCTYMSKELSSVRREPIQIQVKRHEGLRVPTSAIQANEEHQPGVYVRSGNTILFKKIVIEYSTAAYSICKPYSTIQAEALADDPEAKLRESDYLKLYDDIVSEGKGLYDGKIIR